VALPDGQASDLKFQLDQPWRVHQQPNMLHRFQYQQCLATPSPADEAAPEPAAAPSGIPKAGEVRKGYKFKGGNPALATNWQKVQ
jgi:hypothetical protein